MFNVVFVAFVSVSAVWVYLDASARKIGKREGSTGFLNISAGAWGSIMLVLWIVSFPIYLMNRKSLTETAKKTPVESSRRPIKAAGLASVGAMWTLMIVSQLFGAALPGCDSAGTQALLTQTITTMPALTSVGAKFVSVTEISQISADDDESVRTCGGVLLTSAGKNIIEYSVKWKDQAAGKYWLETRILANPGRAVQANRPAPPAQ